MGSLNILIYDPDKICTQLNDFLLENFGQINIISSLEEAFSNLQNTQIDVFIFCLSGSSNYLYVLKQIKIEFQFLPLIAIDNRKGIVSKREIEKIGVDDYLRLENLEPELLIRSIKYAIERNKLNLEKHNNLYLFENLFNHSNLAIYILFNGKFEKVNQRFIELFGYNLEELNHPDFNINSIIPLKSFKENYEMITDREPVYEFTTKSKNGIEISCEIVINYLNYKDGVAVQGIIKDISEKKETEKALLESEEKFKRVFENIPIGIYRTTPKGELLFANNSLCKMLGYNFEELKNINITETYLNPDNRNKFQHIIESTGIVYAYEDIWVKKNGSILHVLESSRSVKDDQGKLLFYEGSVQDITERKMNEIQLNIQNMALRTAANGIVITDREGKIIWINPAFTKLTGYSEEEVFGRNPRILKSEKHPDSFYKYLWSTISTGHPWRGEITNKRKDGNLYVEEQTITPVIDERSEITHYIAIKQDVTERKQTEQALVESEERFRSIFENAVMGIFRATPNAKFQMANPALLKMFGYNSYREMVLSDTNEFSIEKYNAEKIIELMKGAEEINGVEAKLKRRNGDVFIASINMTRVLTDEGDLKFYEGTIEDTTERKQIEEQLIRAKENAEKSDKLKSEFLAQISHEIRTPINTILNFVSLLKADMDQSGSDDASVCFDAIGKAGNRLIRTIDLILNMAELQTGTYEFKPVKFDILSCFNNQIAQHYNKAAETKNNLIIFDVKTADTNVFGDEYSITQIISNLLDNAVKYTDNGKIFITLYENDKNHLIVEISDSGIGISEEYLPYIFELFTQEEQGYTRKFDGNGLGLSLVKKYCDLNNFTISVKSKKGEGTSFRIEFNHSSSTI